MVVDGKVQRATVVCSITSARPKRACLPVASCQRETGALQGMASKLNNTKKSFSTNLGTVYFISTNKPEGLLDTLLLTTNPRTD